MKAQTKENLKQLIRLLIAGTAYVVISFVIVTVVALVLKSVLVYGDWLWGLF